MISNDQIADHFSLLSKLMDIHGENEFRAKSYAAAAFGIDKLPVQLSETDPSKWISYKGIGESAAKKIKEILETGALSDLTRLLEKTPKGVLEMLGIKGIGPKKIAVIWKEMGIESIGELLYACEENRLLHYKGFGEKTQNTIADNIRFFQQHKDIHLYRDVEAYALSIQEHLETSFPEQRTTITGEFRRQMEIIHQLEWVTTIPAMHLTEKLTSLEFKITEALSDCISAIGDAGIKVKFHLCEKDSYGSTLFLTSSSEYFLNQWGTVEKSADEETVFTLKDKKYLPPYLREENSPDHQPEDLIQVSSIKGIIHSHSNWSDGSNTLEEMAEECIRKGFEYLVISDHSKTASYAQGLTIERVRDQHLLINELNKKLFPFKIFKSIESDILGDGSLDYHDALLETFDLVIASVHSNLRMNEEKAMMRLMNAIENPFTTILGHMTGRLLLSRSGYPVDHRKIIDACAANHVAIEINAHPRRLDIDWRWIHYAMEKGVYLSINPDAHALSGFDDIRYGVLVAQKGGLTNERNLSSLSLNQFEQYLIETKKK
jgi:DNA polymerase (family 10)